MRFYHQQNSIGNRNEKQNEVNDETQKMKLKLSLDRWRPS